MPTSLCRYCCAIMAFALTGVAATASPMAATDRLADYSHRLPLRTVSSQAIVRLPLPRPVYLNARSSSLHDLRVFDAVGASMPFALVDQAPPVVEKKATAPVAIFPLYGTARDAGPMPESLQIRTRSDGAVISVTTPSRAASNELQSLILDLQPAALAAKVSTAAPVGALSLSLPPGMDNYNAHVAVDVSNDLQDWDVLAEAAVSWLVNDRGASVGKHRIEFSPQTFRYARIRWLEGKPLAFADIKADYVVQQYGAIQLETIVFAGAASCRGARCDVCSACRHSGDRCWLRVRRAERRHAGDRGPVPNHAQPQTGGTGCDAIAADLEYNLLSTVAEGTAARFRRR